MTKQERIAICESFLTAEGYRPNKDTDDDLVFKSEGHLFAIMLEAEDEQFYRVIFPNFWAIENEAELNRAIVAAHKATSSTKVAKIFFVENNVWAGVELFCASPEQFTAVIERSVGAIKAAVNTFIDAMRSSEEK